MIKPNRDKNELWDKDCDYAGDSDSRRSVSGFVVYILGVPAFWRSEAQRSVILSSSGAEWVAISKVKEVMFMIQSLRSMKISVKLLVTVSMDNVGVNFVESNVTTMTCWQYVNEYVENRIICVCEVSGEL